MRHGLALALGAALMPLSGASAVSLPSLPPAATIARDADREAHRALFAALREGRATELLSRIDALPADPATDYLRAEALLKAPEPEAIRSLLVRAPDLPQAGQLARLLNAPGMTALPPLPAQQDLIRVGASRRAGAKPVNGDPVARALAPALTQLLKADRLAEAEALLADRQARLGAEARTEWQQRLGWAYFIDGNDIDARRLAAQAIAGSGAWVVQAQWLDGLAAWRLGDCTGAHAAFDATAAGTPDPELRAAGHFWAARAAEACGRADEAQPHLALAADGRETFYGLLAIALLDRPLSPDPAAPRIAPIHRNLEAATKLAELGELDHADRLLRHQARIGRPADHIDLIRLADRLGMPGTHVWLSQNAPRGAGLPVEARFPTPAWAPQGGWRVDPALIFAHSLQESQFRPDAVSRSGAIGLMQLMPGTAELVARRRALPLGQLTLPALSLEYGQSYLEMLRDMPATQGLLPKIIAAYNAGPGAVGAWNDRLADNGDSLLFVEMIPYAETRGYVATVLRNYWMYELRQGRTPTTLKAMAQGLWPRFPGLPGDVAVRTPPRPAGHLATASD